MGYGIRQTKSEFRIDRKDFAAAVAAIRALPVRKYDWTEPGFEKIGSLVEMLDYWRWHPKLSSDADGSHIVGLQFEGEKYGEDCDVLFATIAPFVQPGSFIHMIGEDGAQWRWVFKDGQCKKVAAKVTFDE